MYITWLSPLYALAASIRLSWWKLKGYDVFATEDEWLVRTRICRGCRFFLRESGQCAICTCWIDAKAMMASEACPKGYWLRIKRPKRTLKR